MPSTKQPSLATDWFACRYSVHSHPGKSGWAQTTFPQHNRINPFFKTREFIVVGLWMNGTIRWNGSWNSRYSRCIHKERDELLNLRTWKWVKLIGFAQVVEDNQWWETMHTVAVNKPRNWWQQLVSNLSSGHLEGWHQSWLIWLKMKFQKKLSRSFDMHFTSVVGIFVTWL